MARRYLIVDDNVAFAENLAEILRDEGSDVVELHDAREALARVRAGRFDALVTDFRMPGLSGPQLVEAVREVDPGLPVVVVTALSVESLTTHARELGVLAFMPKPLPVDRFLKVLAAARRDARVAVVESDALLPSLLSVSLRDSGFTLQSLSGSAAGALQHLFAAVGIVRVSGGPAASELRQLAVRAPHVRLLVATPPDLPLMLPGATLVREPFSRADLVETLSEWHARSSAS